MDSIILSGLLAFSITFLSIPVIIEVAKTKNLYDEPNGRKVHHIVTPTLGGLGIFAGFVLASLLCAIPSSDGIIQYIFASVMIIFFIGIKDDILITTASKKLVGQVLAAAIIIYFGGIRIDNLYGFMGIHELNKISSILFTLFSIVVITNSFNLIDGVDGLAGSLGLFSSLIFGVYFFITGQMVYAIMAISLVGSIGAFLIFNFHPAKIFMGDTGSLLIGLLNAIFVIKFIAVANDPSAGFLIASSPAIGFAILMVPLFDTLRVVGIRLLRRRSPFRPDKNHIHHLLLQFGLPHFLVPLVCVGFNIAFIVVAFLLKDLGTTWVFLALAVLAIGLVSSIYFRLPKFKRKALSHHRNIGLTVTTPISKVVTFSKIGEKK
jgi:UDP-N-acetylmuramyl pentapeptide phosphotransferase/UDP-N-acetylglucosamine-1-phosphate transferase